MELSYTTPNGRLTIRQAIDRGKDAFEFVAKLCELFEEEACGCCRSKRVVPSVREHDSYKFYEWKCLDCTARMSFGQHKEGGTLFAKRWDSEARAPLPDNGWSVYQGNQSDGDERQGGYDGRRPSTAGNGRPAPAQAAPRHSPEASGAVPF